MPPRGLIESRDRARNFWSNVTQSRISTLDRHGLSRNAPTEAETREALFVERAAVIEALHSINARINALLPVSHIPPEILAHIFLYCVLADQEWRNTLPGLGWISVTHVCRRWRHIALDNSGLWRHIPLTSGRQWIAEMLSRSRSKPLIFSWAPAGKPRTYVERERQTTVVDQLARVERLDLGHFDYTIDIGLNIVLQSPAPIIEVAEINCSTLIFPRLLFDDSAPRLRNLSLLACCDFSWKSSILSNIISLRVQNDFDEAPLATAADVLSALGTMRVLQTLVLIRCLPEFHPDMMEESFVFSPPDLKEVELHGRVVDCIGLLRHLRFPGAGIELKISGPTQGEHVGSFSDIFPLAAKASGLPAAPFTRMAIEYDLGIFSLKANRSEDDPVHASNVYPSIDLSLSQRIHGGWNATELLEEACRRLPIEQLEDISIKIVDDQDSEQPLDPSIWLAMLARAKNIRRVELRGLATYTLCQALSFVNRDGHYWENVFWEETPDLSLGDRSGLLFPNLTILRLYIADFFLHFNKRPSLASLLRVAMQIRTIVGAPQLSLELDYMPPEFIIGSLNDVVTLYHASDEDGLNQDGDIEDDDGMGGGWDY